MKYVYTFFLKRTGEPFIMGHLHNTREEAEAEKESLHRWYDVACVIGVANTDYLKGAVGTEIREVPDDFQYPAGGAKHIPGKKH